MRKTSRHGEEGWAPRRATSKPVVNSLIFPRGFPLFLPLPFSRAHNPGFRGSDEEEVVGKSKPVFLPPDKSATKPSSQEIWTFAPPPHRARSLKRPEARKRKTFKNCSQCIDLEKEEEKKENASIFHSVILWVRSCNIATNAAPCKRAKSSFLSVRNIKVIYALLLSPSPVLLN